MPHGWERQGEAERDTDRRRKAQPENTDRTRGRQGVTSLCARAHTQRQREEARPAWRGTAPLWRRRAGKSARSPGCPRRSRSGPQRHLDLAVLEHSDVGAAVRSHEVSSVGHCCRPPGVPAPDTGHTCSPPGLISCSLRRNRVAQEELWHTHRPARRPRSASRSLRRYACSSAPASPQSRGPCGSLRTRRA